METCRPSCQLLISSSHFYSHREQSQSIKPFVPLPLPHPSSHPAKITVALFYFRIAKKKNSSFLTTFTRAESAPPPPRYPTFRTRRHGSLHQRQSALLIPVPLDCAARPSPSSRRGCATVPLPSLSGNATLWARELSADLGCGGGRSPECSVRRHMGCCGGFSGSGGSLRASSGGGAWAAAEAALAAAAACARPPAATHWLLQRLRRPRRQLARVLRRRRMEPSTNQSTKHLKSEVDSQCIFNLSNTSPLPHMDDMCSAIKRSWVILGQDMVEHHLTSAIAFDRVANVTPFFMAHHLSCDANTYLLMAEVIVACSQYLTQSPFHFRFDHLSIPANQKKRFPLRTIAECRGAQSPKL